jgi:hypothetical protein
MDVVSGSADPPLTNAMVVVCAKAVTPSRVLAGTKRTEIALPPFLVNYYGRF